MRRGDPGGRADRLPGPGPAFLCPRRALDGDHLRHGKSPPVHGPGAGGLPGHPILIDKFLEDAIEVDVDAISDGETTVVAGIMEHIEEAGIHSGDSACVLPTITFRPELLRDDRAPDEADRRRTPRRGPHEHPVRDQERRALRPGGQPPAPRGPSPSSARRSESRWRSWRRR